MMMTMTTMNTKTMTTEPATAGPRPRRKHAATGGRIMVAGVAASAGLLMVGAMVAAARTEASAPQVVQRVVVIETPAVGFDGAGAPAIDGNVTIVREVRILPSAPAESASAAPSTTSSGS